MKYNPICLFCFIKTFYGDPDINTCSEPSSKKL